MMAYVLPAWRVRSSFLVSLLYLLPALAFGQSPLTVYGVVDAGLVLEPGGAAGRAQRLTSGIDSGSRLGLRGSEALGSLGSASFVLERGIYLDTGAAAQGGLLFGRQAFVSLSGTSGQLSAGRQYSPYFKVARDIADPFVLGMAGNAGNILATNARVDHALLYGTPPQGAWAAEFLYAPADHSSGAPVGSAAGASSRSAAVRYQQAGWRLGLAQHQQDAGVPSGRTRNTMLAVQYRSAGLTLQGALAQNRVGAQERGNDLILGLSRTHSTQQYLLSYIVHHDGTAARRHASQMALGYLQRISPRTSLYAAYARLSNRHGADFHIGNSSEAGSASRGVNLGIETSF